MHRLGEELSLERLTEPAVEQYLTARLGTRPLPAGLVRRLYQRTGGNPLFLATVIDTWVRQGWPEPTHGQPTDVGTALEDVPESLRQLIVQQYDALDPDTQQVLDAASATGHQFTPAAVAAGLKGVEDQAEALCDALVRRGQWLRADTPEGWADGTIPSRYQFVHSMYQEVVYQRLSMRRRAQLHQRIGARAEAAYGQQASERAAELGIHFLKGRDAPRAVQYLRLAADNALRRWGYEEAIAHLSQALEVLPALPETPERAQEELRILTVLGQQSHAVRDAATDHGVACLGHLAWVLWFMGHAEEALRRSGEAVVLAQSLALLSAWPRPCTGPPICISSVATRPSPVSTRRPP